MALTKFAYLRLFAITVLALSIVLTTSNIIRPSKALATHDVSISGFAFNPQFLAIDASDIVTWTNNDGVIHTLWFVKVADKSTYLMSPPIAPGESWAYTFTEKVALDYYCFERLWITGFIRLIPGDATGDNFVDVSDFAILGRAWFKGPGMEGYDPRVDFSGDNFIDVSDFALLGRYWFQGPP